MTEYQLRADRRARDVRRLRVAVLALILWTVGMASCGTPDSRLEAGVPVSGRVERATVIPQAVVDPVAMFEQVPATTTTTVHSHAATVTFEPAPVPASADTQANRALGKRMAAEVGWVGEQWTCLDLLWSHESGWKHTATNPSSGAYGIPQSLPGSKMAAAGADWRTNPATQIAWGLSYVSGRHGAPCAALTHSRTKGWY